MSPFVFKFFHWAEWFEDPPMSLSVLLFHSYIEYSIVWLYYNLTIHVLIDIWIATTFWLLWTMTQWMFVYMCLYECVSPFLLGKYSRATQVLRTHTRVWGSREPPFCHPPVCPHFLRILLGVQLQSLYTSHLFGSVTKCHLIPYRNFSTTLRKWWEETPEFFYKGHSFGLRLLLSQG